jgi:hypothetical protein
MPGPEPCTVTLIKLSFELVQAAVINNVRIW